ncbi:hypothetical protein EYZ11_003804 [Aspergillus tanneri]|uniref:DUF6546 domain-containing protein n=1 Tax=Aspergillus tanneri TaxID=1220188 RepID=A0A4S3JPG3_9EURO|nr:hypothetical protein EYZ11_003804 [Aspergillus tanneri]
MAGWNDLPTELRLAILELLAEDPGLQDPAAGKRPLSCYCYVSHEISDIYSSKVLVGETISNLFYILSRWCLTDTENGNGISLEISAHAPGDYRDAFGSRAFQVAYTAPYDPIEQCNCLDPHVTDTRSISIIRLFTLPMTLLPELTLPMVGVVTTLIVRRQTHRQFSAESYSRIVCHLPNLRYIRHETWRELSRSSQPVMDADNRKLLWTVFPQTLKSLSLFKDFNEHFIYEFHGPAEFHDELFRDIDPSVGFALAAKSQRLEHLSAGFIVDATSFFIGIRRNWGWDNLLTLALTSNLFQPDMDLEGVNELLFLAGKAALKMPQLRVMELWNGGHGFGSIFRYDRRDDFASVTWLSSVLKLQFRVGVVDVWNEVAHHHDRPGVRFFVETLDRNGLLSHGDTINMLVLRYEVLDPMSLYQIVMEGRYYS